MYTLEQVVITVTLFTMLTLISTGFIAFHLGARAQNKVNAQEFHALQGAYSILSDREAATSIQVRVLQHRLNINTSSTLFDQDKETNNV